MSPKSGHTQLNSYIKEGLVVVSNQSGTPRLGVTLRQGGTVCIQKKRKIFEGGMKGEG